MIVELMGSIGRSISGFRIDLETLNGKNHSNNETISGINTVPAINRVDTGIPLIESLKKTSTNDVDCRNENINNTIANNLTAIAK